MCTLVLKCDTLSSSMLSIQCDCLKENVEVWCRKWSKRLSENNLEKISSTPVLFRLLFVSASIEMKNSECFVKGIKKHVLHFATWSLTCTTTWRQIWFLLRKIISRMKLNTFTFKMENIQLFSAQFELIFVSWNEEKKNYVYSIQKKNLAHFSVIEWASSFDGFWNKYTKELEYVKKKKPLY